MSKKRQASCNFHSSSHEISLKKGSFVSTTIKISMNFSVEKRQNSGRKDRFLILRSTLLG